MLMALWLACATPEEAPPPPPPAAPDNLLLITLDTTRADHLGAYGYPRDTSPAMDLLASQSLVFDQAISPMSTTLPTHWSILSGAYPLEHGILGNFGNREEGAPPFQPHPGLRSLASIVSEQGWQTAAFVSAVPLKRHTGIDAGFQHFSEPREEIYYRPAQYTIDRAIDWLGQAREDAPFFLWVHLFDPHFPYTPPEGYAREFQGDQEAVAARLAARGVPEVINRILAFDGSELAPASTAVDMINRYDAEIRYMDAQLARLLSALQSQGRWENTSVVLVGDHGEGLGQHSQVMHGDVYTEQLRVPMMIRVPGAAAGRVAHPVSAVDALPTALSMMPGDRSGFLAQSTGRDARAVTEPVFSQRTGDHRVDYSGPAWALRDGPWLFVHEPGARDRLHNLERDPFELVDVAAEEPERAAAMGAAVRARRDELAARYVAGEGTGEGLSQELIEGLEALGYMHD
jgi:choline-sulfatase